jgi:hypothetical protein
MAIKVNKKCLDFLIRMFTCLRFIVSIECTKAHASSYSYDTKKKKTAYPQKRRPIRRTAIELTS